MKQVINEKLVQETFESLKSLKRNQRKLEKFQENLEMSIKLKKLLLRRTVRLVQVQRIEVNCKGWIMDSDEEELNRGWKRVKIIIPEEKSPSPDRPKRESAIKSVANSVMTNEDSESEELAFIPHKRRNIELPSPRPELEEAKRLMHILSKNSKITWPFEEPVDPVALDIPDYPKIVKRPMDLSTVHKRLHEGHYNSCIQEFVEDMRLIFTNAVLFNDPKHQIYRLAIQCSNLFEKKLEKCKNITPPLPLGLGRSPRWKDQIAWRRASVEEHIVWGLSDSTKNASLARNPFRISL